MSTYPIRPVLVVALVAPLCCWPATAQLFKENKYFEATKSVAVEAPQPARKVTATNPLTVALALSEEVARDAFDGNGEAGCGGSAFTIDAEGGGVGVKKVKGELSREVRLTDANGDQTLIDLGTKKFKTGAAGFWGVRPIELPELDIDTPPEDMPAAVLLFEARFRNGKKVRRVTILCGHRRIVN